MFEYGSDFEVTRWLDWPRRTQLSEVIDFLAQRESKWLAGEEYYWVITCPPESKSIGGIACRVDGTDADIGFVLNRDHWGHGYATEAALVVIEWAMAFESVQRIVAVCDAENLACARVLEKIGMACKAG